MRTWLVPTVMFAPVIAYWLSTIWAARLLPRQRRRIGDTRPVPDLFDPMTSHRWMGVILSEKTSSFSGPTKRAFQIARLSFALIPVGFMSAMVIASSVGSPDEPSAADVRPPPVTLQPMSEAEWRANIKDGIGCSLRSGEHLLLLVILGEGSIAKTGDTVRKLSGGESGFDWKGGRYETDGLIIDVRAGTTSEAQVTVASGDQREQFRGRWGCGS